MKADLKFRRTFDLLFTRLLEFNNLLGKYENNHDYGDSIREVKAKFASILDSDEVILKKRSFVYDVVKEVRKIYNDIQNAFARSASLTIDDVKLYEYIVSDLDKKISEFEDYTRLEYSDEKFYEQVGKLEGRIEDIEVRESRLREIMNVLETEVRRFEEERKIYFERFDRSIQEFLSQGEKKIEERVEVVDGFLGERLIHFEQKGRDIDVLIAALGGKSSSASFMVHADKEGVIAERFRWAAIIAMIGIAVVLGLSLSSELLNPELIAMKIGFAAFSSFVVAYLAKQSAFHRAQQHKFKQKALDLSGINTYIADLPKEEQNSIKVKIAEKIFIPAETLAALESSGFGAHEILAKIIDKMEFPKK